MTFTQAVRSVLSDYATFSGRARRSEYWWFYLFTILVSFATSAVDAVLDTVFNNEFGVVGTIAALVLFVPSLAVTARRLHDTGRTGWWMLLPMVSLLVTIVVGVVAFIAVVFSVDTNGSQTAGMTALLIACVLITIAGFITLLVFLCLDTKPGPNKYGPSPKEPTAPTGPSGHHPFGGYSPVNSTGSL